MFEVFSEHFLQPFGDAIRPDAFPDRPIHLRTPDVEQKTKIEKNQKTNRKTTHNKQNRKKNTKATTG